MQAPGIPENEEQRLKSLYITGLLDTRDDERVERLTRLACKAFQVPVALISLLDRERQWLLACQGVGVRETPRDISFCGHAILQEGPFIIHDAAADARFHDNPLVTGEPHIRFYAGQPVSLPDGTVDDLAWDLGERAIVVAVGKAAQLETCEHPKLFRLRLPCSRGELASAVNMLLQLQRMRQPDRSEGEKRAIAEAKALLMNKFAMTEPEAHHSLQKRAMDQGLKLPGMAAKILASNA